MIVNIRTYTLVPRMMPKYLKLFEEIAMPLMQRHGIELLGYYSSVVGPQNQVVHLWRYDSMADMERKRAPTPMAAVPSDLRDSSTITRSSTR